VRYTSVNRKAVKKDFMHGTEAELKDHPRWTCDQTAALIMLSIEPVLSEAKKRLRLTVAAATKGMQGKRNAKRATTVSLLDSFMVFPKMAKSGRAKINASVAASKIAVVMIRARSYRRQLESQQERGSTH